MKFPKGKGFDLAGGLVITVVLDDQVLTGTFLGGSEDRHCDDPPIIVNVTVDEDPEFILLQLTCALEVDDRPEFPVGTIIAINVREILFVAPNGTCEECRS
jgi:hypothetical protein